MSKALFLKDNYLKRTAKGYGELRSAYSDWINLREHRRENCNSRLINHWEKEGLIDDYRVNGSGWRKYSIVECIWLDTIEEMRKLNLPLVNIRSVHQYFRAFQDRFPNSTMPVLELGVAELLCEYNTLHLLLFPNGESELLFKHEIIDSAKLKDISSYIVINLNKIVAKYLPIEEYTVHFDLDWSLTDSERDLLILIRCGQFQEFHIKSNAGEIERLNLKKIVQNKREFRELAKNLSHFEERSVYTDGKLRYIELTLKKKYKVRSQ